MILAALQRALEISAQMHAAAEQGEWTRVVELDIERQSWIGHPPSEPSHGEALMALQESNRLLLERATTAHAEIEHQLEQHKYNHRALSAYITSAS
ncbi:MAG: hypothetical protein WA777_03940 [Rhodanobacter sp.]